MKGDEYICSKCDDNCSRYIRVGNYTRAEIEGHMEYIKRLDRIFKEVITPGLKSREFVPSIIRKQGIEFFDEYGMFRIIDKDRDRGDKYPVELFRYDQVANWESYLDESEPDEPGKEKIFGECGVIITLAGARCITGELRKGVRVHPYITNEIRVCFTSNENEKKEMLMATERVIAHFDHIFGVNDDKKGLFDFGLSKQDKRDLKAGIAFAKTAMEAVKLAKDGGEDFEEKKAEIMENMNAMKDAQTNGLAEYTRRADAAEDKIN